MGNLVVLGRQHKKPHLNGSGLVFWVGRMKPGGFFPPYFVSFVIHILIEAKKNSKLILVSEACCPARTVPYKVFATGGQQSSLTQKIIIM